MARIIVYDGREHPDPDPAATIDEVKDIMAQFYPEISTASHKTEKRGTDTLHVFTKSLGTKGHPSPQDLAGIIVTIPPTQLEAVTLYNKLANSDGSIDDDRLSHLLQEDPKVQQQLEEASADASRYVQSVRAMRTRILELTHR